MGTRGFIGFVLKDVEHITYNHWDSYPSGLGSDILAWARQADFDHKVREQVANLRLVDESQPATAEDAIRHALTTDTGVSEQNREDWYCLLRGTQGNPEAILEAGAMIDSHEFPYDSLFAEWGYLINLDDGTFEVYQGFQQQPPRAGRWATPERIKAEQEQHDKAEAEHPSLAGMSRYYAVSLIAVWPLHDLPTDEDFLLTTEGPEGD